ncbi:D-inositol-3-phosphate glycosyltransferase [Glaciihabitans tibetensis]|uniref:D-inositol-3-phosphate glycosyltransferase n=1 Tax=Glaciihabitans tibetensis TaxID=1266600 RepID=A0A2T0VH67_9MICO|nr:glycosyltransferase [Glaciihabitans tibetensis]PRY69566.1 D-inositol-3-phosphate glycosyltransferase [Glaciihabitans tibetensis]
MPALPTSLTIALVCLHTSPGAEPGSGDAGGMNVVVRHQAEALAAAGHTVQILTRRSAPELPESMQLAPGVTLRFLRAGPAEPVAKGTHEDFIEEFRDAIGRLDRFDIMHSHHWFSGMAALPLARATGIPHVQSFHSIAADDSSPLSEGERAESAGRMAGEAWLARESDAVIAISRAEAATVIERLGAAPDRVFIVPPGVDGQLFHPTSPRTVGRGYAVVAARLQPLKGLDLAIDAIAAVPAGIRPDLVIAGDASSDFAGYTDELMARAAAHGIQDSVRFVGPQSREKLAALLRDARLVLVPSHSETFGLVALEGAASGVPVIAAAAGGLREAIDNQNTGIVLDSRDPAVWAEAISAVLTSDELSRRLSHAARQRAELFNWPRSAQGLIAVYNSLARPAFQLT